MKIEKFIVLILSAMTFYIRSEGQNPIDVTEKTIKVAGLGEEILYYGFASGDKVIFSFEEVNGRELKEIDITELPSSSKFSDFKTSKIENKTLNVVNKGVYKFRFTNTALSGRICKIKIQRIPISERTNTFNTSVYWKEVSDTTYTVSTERYLVKKEFKPERIIKEKHYINSGSNATLKGGKSRITVNVSLPKNTLKWYYVFSASRNEQEIANTHNSINLLNEISSILDKTGTINFGAQMLTQPPGGNVCDVYLLDRENATLFEQKVAYNYFRDFSRQNLASGVVQITNTSLAGLYLGIKNPDEFYGIHTSLEVVAITLNEEWGTKEVRHPNIVSHKEAYLND